MLKKLEKFLRKHYIPYKISYGGENYDTINIEFDDYAVIEDGKDLMVCQISTCNFAWTTLKALKQYILALDIEPKCDIIYINKEKEI